MERQININGVELNYRQGGEGSPMILLHGWGSELGALSVFEKVGREQHEVFNIDLPGFGKSSEPPKPWGVEEYTRLIEDFVKRLKLANPIILGHSFGGKIAINYASRNPVEKLILVDAACIKPRRSMKYYIKVYSYKLGRMVWPIIYGKKRAQEKIEERRRNSGSDDYRNASPMMRQVMVKVVNTHLRDRLSSITAPTLLIWGENDTATPMSHAHIIHRCIKDSTLISFPGAGHFSFLDNPFPTEAALRRFINKRI